MNATKKEHSLACLESELATAQEILLQERELLRAENARLRELLKQTESYVSGSLRDCAKSGHGAAWKAHIKDECGHRKLYSAIRAALKEPN